MYAHAVHAVYFKYGHTHVRRITKARRLTAHSHCAIGASAVTVDKFIGRLWPRLRCGALLVRDCVATEISELSKSPRSGVQFANPLNCTRGIVVDIVVQIVIVIT